MNDRCYDEQDGYEYILRKVKRLEHEIENIIYKLDKMEKHIKDIDMDLNDIFDDVEGKKND